jgi:hypothetical protein
MTVIKLAFKGNGNIKENSGCTIQGSLGSVSIYIMVSISHLTAEGPKASTVTVGDNAIFAITLYLCK